MTKEEAIAEYRRQTDMLMFPRENNAPETAPIMSLTFELERIVRQLSPAKGTPYVEKRLEDAEMLMRALIAPTQIVWTEPSGEMERDPVSGNPRPKMKRCCESAKSAYGAFVVKESFLDCTRALAAFAKRITATSFAEWRDIYIALEKYFARNGKLDPMDEDFASETVARFNAALFALWADNEIGKENRHV